MAAAVARSQRISTERLPATRKAVTIATIRSHSMAASLGLPNCSMGCFTSEELFPLFVLELTFLGSSEPEKAAHSRTRPVRSRDKSDQCDVSGAALEKELAGLGVASTLTDTARRVMERSAEQAGFYEAGRDRLVMPGFVPSEQPPPDQSNELNGTGGGTGSGSGSCTGLDLDPLLIALLKKIPAAEKGWPAQTCLRWFRTFAMNVSQIYDADEDEPVEMDIDLEKKEAAN